MTTTDLPTLLGAPYTAPFAVAGFQTTCLFRDCEVVVTSWTDAPTPWPRCRALHLRGGSGLLVTDELVRAVRTESAQAVMAWWGVSSGVVWRWRKAFGVGGRDTTPGSKQAITAAAKLGAEAMKRHEYTPEEREARRETNLRLNLGRHLKTGYHGRRWTAEELAMLDDPALTNAEVARQVGRSWRAVWQMRRRRAGL